MAPESQTLPLQYNALHELTMYETDNTP